jgi:hypothetical protein
MQEQYYRVNIYKGGNYTDDIEISYSFEDLPKAYENYNKEVEQNKGTLVELVLEVQEGITGTVYTLTDNTKQLHLAGV